MSAIHQGSECSLDTSLIVPNGSRKPLIYDGITFDIVNSHDVSYQKQLSSLENNSVSPIDEHEQDDSLNSLKSLKRKFTGASIADCIEKLPKNEGTESCKEAKDILKIKNVKNKRHTRKEEDAKQPIEENCSSCSEESKVNYALISEQSTDETRQLVLCKNQTPLENVDTRAAQAQLKLQRINNKLRSFVKQSTVSDTPELLLQQYQEHFEHAFHCAKLSDGKCHLARCTDPAGIVTFVKEIIDRKVGNAACVDSDGEKTDMVIQVLVNHSLSCVNKSSCNMPLCSGFDDAMEKVTSQSAEDDFYEVVFTNGSRSNSNKSNVFYKRGLDFDVLFDMRLAKGAFGTVSYSCFVDRAKNKSGVAIKRIDFTASRKAKQIWDVLDASIPMLRRVRDCPNVLVPDLILRTDREMLMVMERAELSLFDYMKSQGGLSPEAVAFYMFQLMKAVNQIHDRGLTHGDIKVPNCVLLNGGRVLKVIDNDSLKEEDTILCTGTPGYVADEVMVTQTVRKPADVHSACCCIPVLLYGHERILKENKDDIFKFVLAQNEELAAMYAMGTMKSATERITSDDLVKWFRHSPNLRRFWCGYSPAASSLRKEEGSVCEKVLKDFFEGVLSTLPQQLQMSVTDDDIIE